MLTKRGFYELYASFWVVRDTSFDPHQHRAHPFLSSRKFCYKIELKSSFYVQKVSIPLATVLVTTFRYFTIKINFVSGSNVKAFSDCWRFSFSVIENFVVIKPRKPRHPFIPQNHSVYPSFLLLFHLLAADAVESCVRRLGMSGDVV